MANARVTQIPVEVAVERIFTSKARVTQIPVEVAVQRIFNSKARVTQLPVEVAIKYIYPAGVDAYTKLLIHGDGENNSVNILDETYIPIEVYGGAKILTDFFKFGGASIYFPANASYIKPQISPRIGTGKFTIDCWVRYDNVSRLNVILSYGGSNSGFVVASSSDNKLKLYAGGDRIVDTVSLPTEEFFHLAVIGNGGVDGSRSITMYKNGKNVGVWNVNYNYIANLLFGANEAAVNECLLGYLDELRLSIGIERWTENFIPPKKPYGMKEYKVNKGLSFSSFGYGNRNIFGYY